MTEKIRVLYLEGRALDAALVREQLAADGLPCSVLHARRKEHFEAALTQGAFELILIDDRLPDSGYLSALEFASARQPGVPLIIISAEAGDEKAVECLRRGAAGYVRKGCLTRLATVVRRALAEAERHRREGWFRSLIENAFDVITVINAEGLIQFQSPSMHRVLGYPSANVLGHNVLELVHPADLPPARAAFQTVLCGPSRTVTVECRWRHRDGHWRVLQCSSRALPVKGGESLVVINARDITEAKQLEAQLRQARTKETMRQVADGIAHDFNNLLSAILGHCEVLAMKLTADGSLRESVTEIGAAAGRAVTLTQQLLAFGRRQALEPQVLDINAGLAGAEDMLHRLTGENVRITTHLQSDLKPVLADPGQLDQVLLNLAINARDAMPHGGTLCFETRNVDLHPACTRARLGVQPGHHVLLAVTDTGTGMSPEVQSRNFEPFFATKRDGQGTGLELATVQGIVEQIGGYMEVYSLPGLGTTYKLYLPAFTPPPGTKVTAGPPDQSPKERRDRVLLVDDEPSVRAVTMRLLESLGYEVLEAAGTAEALNLVEGGREDIDLLMTDVLMQGRNGRELADTLRRRDPNLKVLFQSGYMGDVLARHGIVESEMAFLQKPFTREVLARKVHEALGRPCAELSGREAQPVIGPNVRKRNLGPRPDPIPDHVT
ncbi:MAG: response regulator [Verrucomicrobia bacterium]|nr:response regulator [Verrucomicrobiota bacterium]